MEVRFIRWFISNSVSIRTREYFTSYPHLIVDVNLLLTRLTSSRYLLTLSIHHLWSSVNLQRVELWRKIVRLESRSFHFKEREVGLLTGSGSSNYDRRGRCQSQKGQFDWDSYGVFCIIKEKNQKTSWPKTSNTFSLCSLSSRGIFGLLLVPPPTSV